MDAGEILNHVDDVSAEGAELFRCLCRSSPWKWETLRFEVFAHDPAVHATDDAETSDTATVNDGGATAASDTSAVSTAPAGSTASGATTADDGTGSGLRAWTRRPSALRVETTDGRLLFSTTGINDSKGGFYVSATRKSWLLPPQLVTPVYNDINLVRRRPEAAYGEPVFGNGRWSAMLDPVELAGNAPVSFEVPYANVVEILSLAEVDYNGRKALEAVVSPNRTYKPFDPAHPLLGPGRSLVRIDWQTGVCVSAAALDGPDAGSGHTLRILGVDEYMLDDLFVEVSMNLTDVREHIPWPLQPRTA
jgi:hypothetical protein